MKSPSSRHCNQLLLPAAQFPYSAQQLPSRDLPSIASHDRYSTLSWEEAVLKSLDPDWRVRFLEDNLIRKGTVTRNIYAAELMPGINVSSFQDVNGSVFDGVLMRDASSKKHQLAWSERRAPFTDQIMRPETHICADQAIDVLEHFRNRLVKDRPNAARGAEGHAQPRTKDDLALSVKAIRLRAAAHALADIMDGSDDPDDTDEDPEEVHFETISTVAGISLAAASASQASQGRRPPAQNPAAKRSRPGSVSTSARGCVSTRARGSRSREVETLDGSIGLGEDLQIEIGKLPIYEFLLGKTGPWKMWIYNAVRPSALPSSFMHNSK